MSLIFFLVFLLSSNASASFDKDNEIALLKMKQQLGNPGFLHSWVEGQEDTWNAPVQNIYLDFEYPSVRVTTLVLQNLDVVAPFPDGICNLTRLDTFILLQSPGIYGPIPSCITKLSNLIYFSIENTSISGPVPDFHNSSAIRWIRLPHNHLSGTIPPSLSALTKLQRLDLSFNHLTGTVPSNLVHGALSTLLLSNNNLTGVLPKCYGLTNFDQIDVSNNRLSGDASFLFGKDKTITYAILANNSFTFDMSYIEFPKGLYYLNLSHNNIYGKVPDTLANALLLGVLNLSYNRLCGKLPQGGNMWQFKAEDFMNNKCLCGSPLPRC